MGAFTGGVNPTTVAEGGKTDGSVFQGLVLKMLEGTKSNVDGNAIEAGQQADAGEATENTNAGNASVDAGLQMACLLGSMGVVQQMQTVQVATADVTEAPTQSTQLTGNPTSINSATGTSEAVSAQTVQVVGTTVPSTSDLPASTAAATTEVAPVNTVAAQPVVESRTEDHPVQEAAGEKPVVVSQNASAAVQIADGSETPVAKQPVSAQNVTTDVSAAASALTETAQHIASDAQPREAAPSKESASTAARKADKAETIASGGPTATAAVPSDAVQSLKDMMASQQTNGKAGQVTAQPVQAESPKPVEKSDLKADTGLGQSASSVAASQVQMHSTGHLGSASAAGVRQSEQVTGARMINQIVTAAKVHSFDGGAAMTLRLDPPQLGQVNMTVTVSEGAVTASIQTTTESARQMLQADISSLKQSLSDAGIRVDNVNVSVGTNLQNGQHPYSGAQHGSAQQQSQGRGPVWSGGEVVTNDVAPELVSAARPLSSSQINYLA